MTRRQHLTAITSLLTGATVWGLIWYPYRVIEQAGLGGVQASLLTYLVALACGILMLISGRWSKWPLTAIARMRHATMTRRLCMSTPWEDFVLRLDSRVECLRRMFTM